LLIEHFGWPSIFLINVPFGLIGIWLTLVHAPRPVKAHARGLDLAGQCLAILALAGLATGCIEAGQYGWSSPVVLGGFAMFLIAGTFFLATEARISEPMLPLDLFTSASVNTTSIVGTLINFGYYGVMFAISLYFQAAKGYAPLAAGLAFVPMTAVLSAVNFASGPLNARFGSRPLIFTGIALSATGYFSLTGIADTTPIHSS
jgi:DHA2 family methylenomycin A resistance protein-like MFS transporter